MKQLIFVFLLFTIIFSSCNTQKGLNEVVYHDGLNQKILLGKIDKKGLTKKPFKQWFNDEYNSYSPDQTSIDYLKDKMSDNAKIVVILATWCPDTQREIPRLFKVLDAIDFDTDRLQILAVDKDFSTGNGLDIAKYNIDKVPTIIYYHYGYEAGRIIESPTVSIEKDLVDFVQRKGKS